MWKIAMWKGSLCMYTLGLFSCKHFINSHVYSILCRIWNPELFILKLFVKCKFVIIHWFRFYNIILCFDPCLFNDVDDDIVFYIVTLEIFLVQCFVLCLNYFKHNIFQNICPNTFKSAFLS